MIDESESHNELSILRVGSKTVHPIIIEISINEKKTPMDLDIRLAI